MQRLATAPVPFILLPPDLCWRQQFPYPPGFKKPKIVSEIQRIVVDLKKLECILVTQHQARAIHERIQND